MIRIRFFGPRELNQKVFFGRTVLTSRRKIKIGAEEDNGQAGKVHIDEEREQSRQVTTECPKLAKDVKKKERGSHLGSDSDSCWK